MYEIIIVFNGSFILYIYQVNAFNTHTLVLAARNLNITQTMTQKKEKRNRKIGDSDTNTVNLP